MVRISKTKGIILKKRELLNKDRLITIFSEEIGKVNVIAKGIKKITSKRLPHTETANLIKAVLYKKNDRYYLHETELISAFSKIKKHKSKIELLYYFFFILERIIPENEKEPTIYKLTKQFLIDLSNNNEFSQKELTFYLNRLISSAGFLYEKKTLDQLKPYIEDIINEKIPLIVI